MLENLIAEYAEIKEEEKRVKSRVKTLNAKIKKELKACNLTKVEFDGVTATLITQDRSKVDEEKLVQRLHELGLDDAIIKVEKPDENKVEGLIYEGTLSPQQIEDCITKKEVETLRISVKKGDK